MKETFLLSALWASDHLFKNKELGCQGHLSRKENKGTSKGWWTYIITSEFVDLEGTTCYVMWALWRCHISTIRWVPSGSWPLTTADGVRILCAEELPLDKDTLLRVFGISGGGSRFSDSVNTLAIFILEFLKFNKKFVMFKTCWDSNGNYTKCHQLKAIV